MSLPAVARRQLLEVLGPEGFFDDPTHLRVYDADAYPMERAVPSAVCLPSTVEQVRAVVRCCARHGLPYAPRGAGTGLSGGCVCLDGSLQISLARLRRILEIDPFSRLARVQPGVVNAALGRAAAAEGLTFAPDPSSQAACTLGGNFAGNSGGPHCLKYGVTLPHVLGATMVMPDGDLLEVGGPCDAGAGVDLTALLTGSEGTCGLAVELTLRLTPLAAAWRTFLLSFPSVGHAARMVSALVAEGTVPAALELIDAVMLQALEQAFGIAFSAGTQAVLLVEIDGAPAALEREEERVRAQAEAHEVLALETARDEERRALLWKARKHAFGAVGRISPNYATQDGVVPRAQVPAICETIARVGEEQGLRVGVVLHAGDGNIHPALLYDERDPDSLHRAQVACDAILDACIEMGGSPTGEHGVGLEKRDFLPRVFGEGELAAQERLRVAFDPTGLCNPGKVLPSGGGCGELRHPGRQVSL